MAPLITVSTSGLGIGLGVGLGGQGLILLLVLLVGLAQCQERIRQAATKTATWAAQIACSPYAYFCLGCAAADAEQDVRPGTWWSYYCWLTCLWCIPVPVLSNWCYLSVIWKTRQDIAQKYGVEEVRGRAARGGRSCARARGPTLARASRLMTPAPTRSATPTPRPRRPPCAPPRARAARAWRAAPAWWGRSWRTLLLCGAR